MKSFPGEAARLVSRISYTAVAPRWASGETAVPAQALGFLAEQGIKFTVIGPAPYEFITPVRDPCAVAV